MPLAGNILEAPLTVRPAGDFDAWWERFSELRSANDPFAAAVSCGFEQDRLAWVFASGYAGALDSMFRSDTPQRRSLCVTEAGGNSPRAIETTWSEDVGVVGTKTFVTLGPDADSFLVLAVRGDLAAEIEDLVVVEVRASAVGLSIEPFEVDAFVPEVSHARVTFDRAAGTLVAEDAWSSVVKPFRLVEDAFVLGATTAFLIRLGRTTKQIDLVCRLVAVLEALGVCVNDDPTSVHPAITYAGAAAAFRDVVDGFDWGRVDAETHRLWERDRALLEVARGAREARLAVASRTFGFGDRDD